MKLLRCRTVVVMVKKNTHADHSQHEAKYCFLVHTFQNKITRF